MQPWTIRQYAGFSTAEESKRLLPRNLAAGQKGLSVAFDLPTHRGYDSDNERVIGDVGKGWSGDRLRRGYENSLRPDPAWPDVRVDDHERRGAAYNGLLHCRGPGSRREDAELNGTIQNDILKEFMVRNTYIYPPQPSMRIIGDIFHYCSANMPKFQLHFDQRLSHPGGRGTADIELGLYLADGLEYIRTGIQAGLDIDSFAPRLSFFWGIGHEPL